MYTIKSYLILSLTTITVLLSGAAHAQVPAGCAPLKGLTVGVASCTVGYSASRYSYSCQSRFGSVTCPSTGAYNVYTANDPGANTCTCPSNTTKIIANPLANNTSGSLSILCISN